LGVISHTDQSHDAPAAPTYHAAVNHVLTQQPPHAIHAVHQNVNITHALQGFGHQMLNISLKANVSGYPACVNTTGLQIGTRGFKISRPAITEHDAATRFAQGASQLPTQSLRAMADQNIFAGEIKGQWFNARHTVVVSINDSVNKSIKLEGG